MRRLTVGLLIGVLLVLPAFHVVAEDPGKTRALKISSSAFKNKESIPSKFTCDGPNVNPPLTIENVPPKALSLALIFDDMDAPRGTYVHWILWNIDPGIKEVQENSVPEGAVQGMNDFKKRQYGGPCPPTRGHRYVFKVFALDVRLTLNPNSSKADLERAVKGHILAQAQWMGIYKRKRSVR